MINSTHTYIEHILENINDIEEFSKGLTKNEFLKDKLRQKAIVRSIEIIGEAAKNIPENVKVNYKEIEWRKIAGTRDRIIHHYFGVDLDIIWEIIKKDLPILKSQIEKLRQEM